MKTAMQELLKAYEKCETYHQFNDWLCNNEKRLLEKEKEQLQKAFSDGQEIPINHPTIPHYSREEYYNDNYNQNK
jgi:hypothetical protein